MKHTLLDYINDKTNNKYSYLKLKEVIYHKKSNKCVVFFIYPQKIPSASSADQSFCWLAKKR